MTDTSHGHSDTGIAQGEPHEPYLDVCVMLCAFSFTVSYTLSSAPSWVPPTLKTGAPLLSVFRQALCLRLIFILAVSLQGGADFTLLTCFSNSTCCELFRHILELQRPLPHICYWAGQTHSAFSLVIHLCGSREHLEPWGFPLSSSYRHTGVTTYICGLVVSSMFWHSWKSCID